MARKVLGRLILHQKPRQRYKKCFSKQDPWFVRKEKLERFVSDLLYSSVLFSKRIDTKKTGRKMNKAELNHSSLIEEAALFAVSESSHKESSLYSVTDGKAVGTYLEHKFQDFLAQKYDYHKGSSAEGLDFPYLMVDMKVTSIRQPQSSCPFSSARQKIYGLGYSLLLFVYQKLDDPASKTSTLDIQHVVFIEESRTADVQMTSGLCQILENQGNKDDLIAFMTDRNLPVDEIQANQLAEEILEKKPTIGYLTISNALQWRLQYRRALDSAGHVSGIVRIK